MQVVEEVENIVNLVLEEQVEQVVVELEIILTFN
jgi:hypothetical protein